MSSASPNSADPADLRIYHRLQLAAHRLQKSADRALIGAAGITAAQAAVLTLVETAPGSTQRALARRLGFNESAITAAVGRLEASGALMRQRDPGDARARVLTLTASGRDALDRARTAFADINARIGDAADGEALHQLAGTLDRLTAAFASRTAG